MARIRVIAGPDMGGVYSFTERVTLGRLRTEQHDNAEFILLTDPRISRAHLQIYRDGDQYFALDKFSSNGSYVEGRRLQPNLPKPLPAKAELKIGETILLFEMETSQVSGESPELPPHDVHLADGIKPDANPSMIINAREWLEELQARGPGADARNLARQIKAITQVSLSLGGKTEPGQLVDQIIRSLFEVFQNADNIFLFAYNEKTQAITSLGNSNDNDEEQVSTTIVRQVIDQGHAILIYDAMDDASYSNNESVHALKLRSVICAPLLFRNQILGLVFIDSRSDANRFSEEDLEILTGISAQIAVAMKNADLFRDIENLLEGFVSASVQVIESRDPVTAGHSFRVASYAEALANAVNKSRSGSLRHISLNDKQIRELRYASLLHDFGKVGVKEHILTKENKLFGHELDTIRLRFEYAKACRERHLYYRLLQEQETQGFSKTELRQRIEEVASQLRAGHGELDKKFARIAQYNEPNLTYRDMTELLNEFYQENFEDLAAAQQPLLTELEIQALKIPQGSLTDHERLEIEMHVVHTYNFLNLIPWTRDLRGIPDIAHAHHEKLDGSGYPNGVKARDIPLQSRIMTIADIYDALTAPDRPYKNSVSAEIALDMLNLEAKQGKIDKELMRTFIEARAYERA